MKSLLLAASRRLRTWYKLFKCRHMGDFGRDIHISANVRLWAPKHINIGHNVYIGKGTHIEANTTIGNYCLIANDVAFVGKNDHDYGCVGTPIRYAPWIVEYEDDDYRKLEEVTIADDVWVGYRSIIMTPVSIGRGAIIATGSVVVKDVRPYEIVAGIPARVVGMRFDSEEEIKEHERKIKNGTFKLSEKSLANCVVEPGD